MTEEQILQLAENYLTFEKWNDVCWKADTLQLLNFARAMYDEGYGIGYDIGAGDEYDRGYIDGVESVRSGVLGD
jgi:hypothetical protein